MLVLPDTGVALDRGVGVAEEVRAEGSVGPGPLGAADRLDLFVGAAVRIELVPVRDLAPIDRSELVAGEVLKAGLVDRPADDDRLAVDADDVIDEVLVAVAVG